MGNITRLKMNKQKRTEVLRILKSGWSATNIAFSIGVILEQPENDILRIINSQNWDNERIMSIFEYFPQSKTGLKNE